MCSCDLIDQTVLANQQGVVANEVKGNVIEQPYGGWPWLDMPQLANENWYNAHNFYGELSDLQAATVEDAKQFFAQAPDVNRIVYDVVTELGGSISAEHGLGVLKREEIKRYKGALELDVMRRVKQALDPAGIMNPGKVLGSDPDSR